MSETLVWEGTLLLVCLRGWLGLHCNWSSSTRETAISSDGQLQMRSNMKACLSWHFLLSGSSNCLSRQWELRASLIEIGGELLAGVLCRRFLCKVERTWTLQVLSLSLLGETWSLVKSSRMTSVTARSLLVCPLPGLPAISWFRLEEEIAEQSSLPLRRNIVTLIRF